MTTMSPSWTTDSPLKTSFDHNKRPKVSIRDSHSILQYLDMTTTTTTSCITTRRMWAWWCWLCISGTLLPVSSWAWTQQLWQSTPFLSPLLGGGGGGRPTSPPSNVKILILPGFGNDEQDYFLKQAPQGSLVQSLQRRGWSFTADDDDNDDENERVQDDNEANAPTNQIRVLPVSRSDWIKVFAQGVLDRDFWSGQAAANGAAFGWYLDRIVTEVQRLCPNENDRVVLVGHSAGGWLGRAALGYCTSSSSSPSSTADQDTDTKTFSLDRVLGLVTLGTPHLPPPPPVQDVTRGALRLTHETFPNDYHAPHLFYITVMGETIQGDPLERNGPSRFAFDSYSGVCGDGTAIGDGVVPVCSGHLTGAIQIDLPGVLHSINAPDNWYGSTNVLDSWHSQMLDCIVNSKNLSSRKEESSWIPQLFLR